MRRGEDEWETQSAGAQGTGLAPFGRCHASHASRAGHAGLAGLLQ